MAYIRFVQLESTNTGVEQALMFINNTEVQVGTLKKQAGSYAFVIDARFPEKFRRIFTLSGMTRKDVEVRLGNLANMALDEVQAGTRCDGHEWSNDENHWEPCATHGPDCPA